MVKNCSRTKKVARTEEGLCPTMDCQWLKKRRESLWICFYYKLLGFLISTMDLCLYCDVIHFLTFFQRVFETICREEIPDLMKHLDDLNCEITPITFNWFMTIFIDSLPVNVWSIYIFSTFPIIFHFVSSFLEKH